MRRSCYAPGQVGQVHRPSTFRAILFVIWNTADARFLWFASPLLGWGMMLAVHGVYAFVMKTPEEIMIERAARADLLLRRSVDPHR